MSNLCIDDISMDELHREGAGRCDAAERLWVLQQGLLGNGQSHERNRRAGIRRSIGVRCRCRAAKYVIKF